MWESFWKVFVQQHVFFFDWKRLDISVCDLIPQNQSGFKPGDSCINQLLSITHEIYKSFDDGWELRGVFLDISKAFDKVWH